MYLHLEKAYAEKPLALMFIRADPFWEPYWEDKRFMDLVELIFNRPPNTEANTYRSDLNL